MNMLIRDSVQWALKDLSGKENKLSKSGGPNLRFGDHNLKTDSPPPKKKSPLVGERNSTLFFKVAEFKPHSPNR